MTVPVIYHAYIQLESVIYIKSNLFCVTDTQEETIVLFSTTPNSESDAEIIQGTPQKKIVHTVAFDFGKLFSK